MAKPGIRAVYGNQPQVSAFLMSQTAIPLSPTDNRLSQLPELSFPIPNIHWQGHSEIPG
jgi:hypothetical protein